MKANFFQYYKELPAWAKGVVVIGGIAAIYVVGSQIVKAIKRGQDQRKQQEEIDAAKQDMDALAKSGVKPTLSKSNYESISSAIIDAVNGCGTSMSKIKSQMSKLSNDADVLALITVFGLRKKQRCVFSDDPREDFWSDMTPPMSLTAHLQSDLSNSDINDINKLLASKGIKYQF